MCISSTEVKSKSTKTGHFIKNQSINQTTYLEYYSPLIFGVIIFDVGPHHLFESLIADMNEWMNEWIHLFPLK